MFLNCFIENQQTSNKKEQPLQYSSFICLNIKHKCIIIGDVNHKIYKDLWPCFTSPHISYANFKFVQVIEINHT